MILVAYSNSVELEFDVVNDLIDADYDHAYSSVANDSEFEDDDDSGETLAEPAQTLQHVTFNKKRGGKIEIPVARVKQAVWFYYMLPEGSPIPEHTDGLRDIPSVQRRHRFTAGHANWRQL